MYFLVWLLSFSISFFEIHLCCCMYMGHSFLLRSSVPLHDLLIRLPVDGHLAGGQCLGYYS